MSDLLANDFALDLVFNGYGLDPTGSGIDLIEPAGLDFPLVDALDATIDDFFSSSSILFTSPRLRFGDVLLYLLGFGDADLCKDPGGNTIAGVSTSDAFDDVLLDFGLTLYPDGAFTGGVTPSNGGGDFVAFKGSDASSSS